ncbi:MAG: DUF6691 family protein [Gallionella sp.]
MKNLASLACGILFGLGLALSGMTDTQKVIGFLDVFGKWVPDLAFVMGGAVLVTVIGYQLVLKSGRPLLESNFHLPTRTTIDTRLIAGAIIFGTGWGLYGYCPGPAIASLAYLNLNSFLFLGAMLCGMLVVPRQKS